MRNILVVVGSGNIKGNTDTLVDCFIKGAIESGHHVKKVNLNGDIQGCQGCGACQKNGNKCVIQDKMQSIYPFFESSDTIVLASPLYFWSISARLKSFIDRLYAISTDDEYPQKDTFLLMTSGSKGFYAFEQAVSFYRFFTNALGWNDKGMVLAGGCHKEEKCNVINEDYLKEAYFMGYNLK